MPTFAVFYDLELDLLSNLRRASCHNLGCKVEQIAWRTDGWDSGYCLRGLVSKWHRAAPPTDPGFLYQGAMEGAAVAEFSCGFVPHPESLDLMVRMTFCSGKAESRSPR